MTRHPCAAVLIIRAFREKDFAPRLHRLFDLLQPRAVARDWSSCLNGANTGVTGALPIGLGP
jgi:hypothetical protein